MNIEIIEFVPIEMDNETGYLSGTIRVCLSNIGIHILGVFSSRKKGRWFFSLPTKIGTDHRDGKKVRYPCILFEDREMKRKIIQHRPN
jgi:hypothetical protein